MLECIQIAVEAAECSREKDEWGVPKKAIGRE